MYVDPEVIESAATLIQTELDNGLPVGDEAEWRGFDPRQTGLLEAVLDAVTFGDVTVMLEQVASRLPEPQQEGRPADA